MCTQHRRRVLTDSHDVLYVELFQRFSIFSIDFFALISSSSVSRFSEIRCEWQGVIIINEYLINSALFYPIFGDFKSQMKARISDYISQNAALFAFLKKFDC